MSMEIDITDFFNSAAPMDYFASAAEIGQNAGEDTWRAACEDSPDHMMLDTDDKRDAFRDHVKDFGAWSDEEIAAWTDVELNALFIQLVSGDIRESDLTPDSDNADWEAYYANDQIAGRLFRGDIEGDLGFGRIYYYVGS